MAAIIGINSAGFNSSSALVVDGQVIFASEEERLIRDKRTRGFPSKGIDLALKAAGLAFEDINDFVVAWNPAINLETYNAAQSNKHRYLGEIFYSVPNNLLKFKKGGAGSFSSQMIELHDGSVLNVHYLRHHLAHASSFFYSPFEEAAILTVDAFGEKECTLFSQGSGNKIRELWSQEFPHSLGGFYSTFTEFAGFVAQGDEWKLMGASSYGDPKRYYEKIKSLLRLLDDGGFELDLSCFNHYQFHRPGRFTPKMSAVLGLKPNKTDQPLTEEYYDLCAAAQRVMEEVYFHFLRNLHARSKCKNLVLAGGVALNSVANGKVAQQTPFENVFVPSAPDDGGGSLGAAFYFHHQIRGNPRSYCQTSNYLGPGYSNDEIAAVIHDYKLSCVTLDRPAAEAAKLIAAGKIVGWFQGRLEFGDRALGNRSILADPREESMKDKVNATVKYREPFRPFAPSILLEYVDEYFVDASPTPFMEKVFPIRPDKRGAIPAVTHVDGSGRLQTVTKEQNALYWELIDEFRKLTGVPIVLNTSFNLKGEAIVCSPADALRTFFTSGLDALIMGNCLLLK